MVDIKALRLYHFKVVTELPHTIVGAAIAVKVGNPALAIPLAFLSHFALEFVPHWNPHLYTETKKFGRVTRRSTLFVAADVALSLAAGFFIASTVLPDVGHFWTVIASSFVAVLPDVLEGPWFFLNFKHKALERLILFQRSLQFDAPLVPGILTQLATIAAAFWWILI